MLSGRGLCRYRIKIHNVSIPRYKTIIYGINKKLSYVRFEHTAFSVAEAMRKPINH